MYGGRIKLDLDAIYFSLGIVRDTVPLVGSGPKGVNDLYFHTYGEFSPPSPPSPSSPPPSYPPFPLPPGRNLSLEAHIPASRPKSQS